MTTQSVAHHRSPATWQSESGARLKDALVGRSDARFVYLGNFEVERAWARDEPKLPGARISFATSTVNRMEEMGILLADPGDVVVLKSPPDPGFLDYLRDLGCAAGRIMVVDHNDPVRSVTEDAVDSPHLIAALGELADGHTHLLPLGVSLAEEQLSARTGLPLAGATSAVCKAVNGKIYSRRLVEFAGLRAVPGQVCETVDELTAAVHTRLAAGGRVVVKESLGVSGRGMVVLDGPRRADALIRMLSRSGRHDRTDMVVESWIEHATDLNYQFVVSRAGEVIFRTVKEAVVERGVHRGHRFPAQLPAHVDAELRAAAAAIGAALFADGYFGMVGVDAILDGNLTLFPCLEINARLNMSSYATRLAERFIGPDQHALATTIDLRPRRVHGFAEVADALGELLFDGSARSGVLVNGFATLNAAHDRFGPEHAAGEHPGRLYAICVADDAAAAAALAQRAENRLRDAVEGSHARR